MLERLLKYPWTLYRAGTIELAWPWSVWLLVALALPVAAWWFAGYASARATPGRRERAAMALLRGVLLAVLLLLLLRPVLVVPLAATQRPELLVLVDESQSMTIADADGVSRARRAEEALHAGGGALSAQLESRFRVQRYAFGAGLRRLDAGQWPGSEAARSELAGALAALAEDAARSRPAAVLLVSDGGMDDAGLDAALLALRARAVPVHALGAGEPRVAPDADLLALRVPERALAGDTVEAELTLLATGLAGRRARVALRLDGEESAHADVDLPADGEHLRVRLPLAVPEPGPVRVEVLVAPLPGERLEANNRATALVEVLERAAPVLHYEGEPRFEVKFLRRAVHDDEALSLVSLVRTAENKFYRLGISDDGQLADGFPRDRATLFGYGVVVLGARAAAAMDEHAQSLLEAFVAERGGALVLLEGTRAGEVFERLSPLPALRSAETPAVVRVRADTQAAEHPLTGFLLAAVDGSTPLQKMPPLTLARRVRAAKPGAATLLLGADGGSEPLVVLAEHRYGRGRVVALPVRDTWRWQMHADVGPHDLTHQTFWRQMLRWLAREVPPRTGLEAVPAPAVPGAELALAVTLRDADWLAPQTAPPLLRLTTPLGDRFELPTRASAVPGRYEARFVPAVDGLWEVRVEDTAGGEPATRWLQVSASGREFHRPALDEALLRRIAEATGGSYRRIAEADGLLEQLRPAPSAQGSLQRLPLWDVPAAYLLLLLLAVGEWAWRRGRRLP